MREKVCIRLLWGREGKYLGQVTWKPARIIELAARVAKEKKKGSADGGAKR